MTSAQTQRIVCTGEDAIKHLLSRGTHREFGYRALITMLVVYFLGAVWAAGSAVASGLFVPMLLIGSCIGRIVGLICVDIAAAGGHGSSGYDPFLVFPIVAIEPRICLWTLQPPMPVSATGLGQ